MPNNPDNVGVGTGAADGIVYIAPVGTTLPTDATSEIEADFVNAGYISEDGLAQSKDKEMFELKDMNGRMIKTKTTSTTHSFNISFLETNLVVMQTVYGDGAVEEIKDESSQEVTGLKWKHGDVEPGEKAVIVELVPDEKQIHRIVIPRAKISELGEITYQGQEAIKYDATMSCLADSDGNTMYEYRAEVV